MIDTSLTRLGGLLILRMHLVQLMISDYSQDHWKKEKHDINNTAMVVLTLTCQCYLHGDYFVL